MTTPSAPHPSERFLILAPTGRDAVLTASLLDKAGLRGLVCRDFDALHAQWRADGALGLIMAEETLVPGALRKVRELLDRQASWSDLPILIFRSVRHGRVTRPPTAQLVADLGNVTLLDRPVHQLTMISAARAAQRSRKRQYEARAALEAEQLAVKQRDQFLAMLGHELRNPLSAISLAAQAESEEKPSSYSEIIRRQAAHLTRLVDDLLDVSRVTSGKIVLQPSALDLGRVVERAVETVRARFTAQDISLSVSVPDVDLVITGDPVRLEQVVVNLLGNAVKYTPTGGKVSISVAREDREVLLAVKDDGLGIPADMLPHIFELFTQVDGALDRAQGGMGIGLTLVRSLVTLHGGSVEVASAGLGQGSEFRVRLPSSEQARDQSARIAVAPTAKGTQQRDVLVVEDNDDSRELLATMLERRGHRVSTAPDGLRGVEVALSQRPDVILVDIGLPGLDGYGVAREVRHGLGTHVYLIALTGYGQPEDRERALEAGFDVHLTKPVDFARLQTLINERGATERGVRATEGEVG